MEKEMEFVAAVEQVVRAIPEGKVLTYGDVAALAGRPSCPRLVGRILGSYGFDSPIPCHRVVNAAGRPAPHWLSQRALLEREGVAFKPGGCVVMKRHRWDWRDDDAENFGN